MSTKLNLKNGNYSEVKNSIEVFGTNSRNSVYFRGNSLKKRRLSGVGSNGKTIGVGSEIILGHTNSDNFTVSELEGMLDGLAGGPFNLVKVEGVVVKELIDHSWDGTTAKAVLLSGEVVNVKACREANGYIFSK